MGKSQLIQVKQANVIGGSVPILLKKWVKVKYVPEPEQMQSEHKEELCEKDRNPLQMAQAIIQGQMKNDN